MNILKFSGLFSIYIVVSLLTKSCNIHALYRELSRTAINPKEQSIAVFSIQKCGTHLLTKCLELMTNYESIPFRKADVIIEGDLPELPKKTFIHTHAPYSLKAAQALVEYNYKAIFIYRDPRDQIVSMAHWIAEKSYKSIRYQADPKSSKYISDLITELIPQTNKKYMRFLAWLKDPNTLSITFEQLIGSKGGGCDKLQAQTMRLIAQHLNYPLSNERLNYSMRNLFGDSATFRKGLVARWKEYFSQDQILLCKKHLGKLLIDLGYEKDLNW